ncbi:MAG: HD domain-containing phosphohydrolase [Candidatus Dormibacteria bacterium]
MTEGLGALHAARQTVDAPQPRLAEASALFAVATDLATGVPLTFSLRTCLATLRIADLLHDRDVDRFALYHLALVKLLGCTVETSRFAAAMGDELRIGGAMGPAIHGSQREMLSTMVGAVAAGSPPLRRVRQLVAAMAFGSQMRGIMAGHCEVARALSEHLRLGPAVAHGLDYVYERWDGRGSPAGARGDEIPLIARIGMGAYEVVVQDHVGDEEHVRAVIKRRSGRAIDPMIGNVVQRHLRDVLDATRVESPWEAVRDADPDSRRVLDEGQVDATAQAIALFTDLKADHLAGHSTGVAHLAGEAARQMGLRDRDTSNVRRASLIHDLGRVAVSTVTWDRAARLDDDQWDAVRLHPYHLERTASRVAWLAEPVRIASRHHERLDGGGYHRGAAGNDIDAASRVVAAADRYQAMTSRRPYRDALPPDDAARLLDQEAKHGWIDARAVDAVLTAAGHGRAAGRASFPAGLSEREVQILRVIADGATIKEAASRLYLSPKTVDTHVQHIYGKVGVTTRAGAAVFAMRHGLLDPVS